MDRLTSTDQRQFVDEINFLIKDKDFSGTFVDALKGNITFKNVDEILKDKRKLYNYAYANLFRKYGILLDDLYEKLDKLWGEEALIMIIENTIKPKFPFSLWDWIKQPGPLLQNLPIVTLVACQLAVKTKWQEYLISTLQFANNYSLELLKDEK